MLELDQYVLHIPKYTCSICFIPLYTLLIGQRDCSVIEFEEKSAEW